MHLHGEDVTPTYGGANQGLTTGWGQLCPRRAQTGTAFCPRLRVGKGLSPQLPRGSLAPSIPLVPSHFYFLSLSSLIEFTVNESNSVI